MLLFELIKSPADLTFHVQKGDVGPRITVFSKSIKVDINKLPSTISGWAKQVMTAKNNTIGWIDIGYELQFIKDYLPVEWVFLAVEARRIGVGVALYNKALEVTQKMGYKGIISDPEARNMNSDAFWNKYSQGSFRGMKIITKPIT